MKIRIVATDDSIWAQTVGRIFYGLCEMMAGIICTCIVIVLIPISMDNARTVGNCSPAASSPEEMPMTIWFLI